MKNRIRIAACSSTMFLGACEGAQAQAGQKMRLLSDQKLAKLLLVSLIDTTGCSADYQEKYIGVVLAQGALAMGSKKLDPGAYGLGTKKITSSGRDSVTLYPYDLVGKKVAEVPAERQQNLRSPLSSR